MKKFLSNTYMILVFAILYAPILILIFFSFNSSNSNVVFTLYIIINSIMTAIISTIIALIMRRNSKGKDDSDIILSNKKIQVVEYSRNYKK